MNLKRKQLQKNNTFCISLISNGQAHQHRAPTPPYSTTERPRRRHQELRGHHRSPGRELRTERQPQGRQPAHHRALTWQVLRLKAPPRLGDQRGLVLLLRTRNRRDVKGPSTTPSHLHSSQPTTPPFNRRPAATPSPPPPRLHPRECRRKARERAGREGTTHVSHGAARPPATAAATVGGQEEAAMEAPRDPRGVANGSGRDQWEWAWPHAHPGSGSRAPSSPASFASWLRLLRPASFPVMHCVARVSERCALLSLPPCVAFLVPSLRRGQVGEAQQAGFSGGGLCG